MNVVFYGEGCVTASTIAGDISADTVRTAILPLYKNFAIERNIELRILKRSSAPAGGKGAGGEVQLGLSLDDPAEDAGVCSLLSSRPAVDLWA